MLAALACHDAVKVNQRLQPEQQRALVKDLFACDNPYFCPHRRPIIVTLTLADIEKAIETALKSGEIRLKIDPASPFDPVPFLLRWFARHRRDLPWRQERSIYRIWVSEVMLQQTRVETVVPYYRNFLVRFPSLTRLARAPLQDVLKAWEGLGYYSRARNLWRAARIVHDDFHGRTPENYDRFRELPGVGDYIAAAVLSIGRGLALPVVDGNVLRVVCRWQGISEDIRLPAAKRLVRSFLEKIIPEADTRAYSMKP